MRNLLILIGLVLSFNVRAGSEGDVTAAKLLSLTSKGELIKETENKFKTETDHPKNTSMYSLTNATFWTSGMAIDCDGRETTNCNKTTDPDFQNELSCDTDIAADQTPFFVIPLGAPANSDQHDIQIGQVGALIYQDKVAYALFLDEGPSNLVGEASCAAAKLLGIDPDPKTGGSDGPVTYLIFTGESGRITDKSDYANHAKAVAIGAKCAKELLSQYPEPPPAAAAAK